MSLILEALRKSEAERRRGQAPDVAMELPPAPASRRRVLGTWLLPALGVAALLLLTGWWVTREPATTNARVTVSAATNTPQIPDAVAPALTPRIERATAPPAVAIAATEVHAPVVSAPSAPAPGSALARPTPPAAISTPLAQARPLPQPATDISNDTSMLPPLKLSMHMWDDVPSKRFVILNGQRMAEGDRYGGITVIAIERAGVVVESNGTKTRVPLP